MANSILDFAGSYTVGDFALLAVEDGIVKLPLTQDFVPNASIEAVNNALRIAGLPQNEITTTINPLLVQRKNASSLTIIDTGFGADVGQRPDSTMGKTIENLAKHKIAPLDIGLVIISHCHPDHVNGLLVGDKPVFLNAEIAVPRIEWEFWMDDAEMSRATPGRMTQLFANNRRVFSGLRDRIRLYDWDAEVVPGIEAIGTPGHSIGHTSFLIKSAGEQVFVQMDITNQQALFVPNPDWYAFFDQDPVMTVTTRRRVYDMLASEKMKVQGFHHAWPGLNYIEKTASGYALVPAL